MGGERGGTHHPDQEGARPTASSGGDWRFLLALFCASSLLEIAAWGHMEAFSPLFLERELGVAEADVPRWAGILVAASLGVALPLTPLWGVLADRYSRKLVIQRTVLVAFIGYGLAALCQDVWQYLGIRLLMGLTFGANTVIISTLAGLAPARHVALAIGLIQMMFPIGKSIGPLLGSAFISLFGLRGMFVADALLVALSFLLVQLLYKEPPRRRDSSLGVLGRLGQVGGVVWRTPTISLAYLLFALFSCGMGLVTPFVPVLIDRVYEGEDVALVIGLVLAAYGALAALSSPLAGPLSNRLGPTRMVTFNMVGMTLMSLGLVVAATPEQVAAMVLLGAIPFGAHSTSVYAHLVRWTPQEHMAAVMSLSPLARITAQLVGSLTGAAVSGLGLPAAFATAAAVFGVAVGVSLLLARVSRQREG